MLRVTRYTRTGNTIPDRRYPCARYLCIAIKKDCVETQRCYGKYDPILRKMNFAKSRDTNPRNQKAFPFSVKMQGYYLRGALEK